MSTTTRQVRPAAKPSRPAVPAGRRSLHRLRRSRWAWPTAAVATVAVAGGLVWASVGSSGPAHPARSTRPLASASVVAATVGVPASTIASVGTPAGLGWPVLLRGQPPAIRNGKPEVLYVGAEYCPYCGVERWAMVQALSRFGRFSGLGRTHSALNDDFPLTQSFSFAGSSYRSRYLSFVPLELYDNVPTRGIKTGYHPLQTPTDADQRLINTYDQPPYLYDDGLPFIDLGNRYFVRAPQFSPAALAGGSLEQIAAGLADPHGQLAINIVGSANLLTGAICELTNDQPASVCSTPTIRQVEAALPAHAAR